MMALLMAKMDYAQQIVDCNKKSVISFDAVIRITKVIMYENCS
jgi:hypothetical protein